MSTRQNDWIDFAVLFSIVVLVGLLLASCSTVHDYLPIAPTAHADCILPDDLQQAEKVTPLPEDHDLTEQEVVEQLKNHLAEESGIAARSNDKTNFVNQNCRDHSNGTVK